ncbi:YciI-like protein [Aestuariivirga litoralis]|uniref:YciI-like protein n=1 Tax=Aestuariivirga litoralis TaxID=2650924 RepID=UPI0018C7F2FA|nr:YciI-like protein [Aestuariivirga litoralis]MBG1232495.1 YciI family protein [Aestuariivirga litoralis]
MLYALYCTDKPNSLDLRMQVRPDHVAYLKTLGDKLKIAGPFLDDAGNMMGSLVVIEAADRAGAEAMSVNDPYAKSGLFAAVEIRAWNWTMNNPDKK